MKNTIKILLLLAVLVGIAVAVIMNLKVVSGDDHDEVIPQTSFEKRIQNRVKNEIKDKSYADATRAYQDILSEIETESSITEGNGKSALTKSEVQKCRQMAYYEYVPIFTKYANDAFQSSSWSDEEMKTMRSNAQNLLGAGIAEGSSDDMAKVRSISKTVDDYFAAMSIVSKSKHCSSAAEVTSVCNQANSYKHAPLTNCSSLNSALASVASNAKNSYASSVVSYCNGVASRSTSYDDYVSWSHAYEGAINRIQEYTSKFGSNSALSAARARLSSADDNVLDRLSE